MKPEQFLDKFKCFAMDTHGNIASKNRFEWIDKEEGTFKIIIYA